MLLGAYFIAKTGIALGIVCIAAGTIAIAASPARGMPRIARELIIAGYALAALSVLVYFGVLNAR